MTADAPLTLAALVLAHLVADFLLQNERIVADKSGSGRRVVRGLALHGLGVAVALLPFVLVFGLAGLWAAVVVTATHLVVDRAKAVATRRAEAVALAEAHARHAPAGSSGVSLGAAWTPVPAALFLVDQLVHLAVIVAAWAILLVNAPVVPETGSAIGAVLGRWDSAAVHHVAVWTVVLASLLIVNVRAGDLFVSILVHPREVVTGAALPDDGPLGRGAGRPRQSGWRLRLGPLEASAEPVLATDAAPAGGIEARPRTHASPARVGATIGVIERLLIATFVLTGNQAAIGFVVAAKTLARFRQLDDRDFAEYYLLGTLASVGVALASALAASAALGTLGP